MELVLVVLISMSFGLIGLFDHLAGRARRRRTFPPSERPPISILRPLAGIDEGLRANLEALARQSYPQFEIVLAAADPADPALEVAEGVRLRFPEVPIRILRGTPPFGLNPKVRNLNALLGAATHEWVLISDSNVRPGAGYLEALSRELSDPAVGLVHNLIVGRGERSLGAAFENLHLNTWVYGAVAAAAWAGHPAVIGKSMLFQKRNLALLGGFDAVRDLLAEDYVLGMGFARLGKTVRLSSHPVATYNVRRSVRDFAARHLRWGQMRRRINPLAFFAEPLLSPIPLLAGLLCFSDGPGLATFACAGLVLKCLLDVWASRRRCGVRLPWWQWLLIPVKDLLLFAVWCAAAVWTRVGWRGHVFRIGPGSRLQQITVPEPELGFVAKREVA